MSERSELDALASDVKGLISSNHLPSPSEFDSLLLRIALAQGLIPEGGGLSDLEPVPEGAFKLMTVACFPPSEAEAVFTTSGTTTGAQGRHVVRDLELYRLSVIGGFRRFVQGATPARRFVSLIPPASERPHSSLSRMVSFVAGEWADREAAYPRDGDRIDLKACASAFHHMGRFGEPIAVLGTTLDFLALFDALGSSPVARLPWGSKAMYTGGSKASGITVTREEIERSFFDLLGIPPSDVIEEYGMTELLSQAYVSPRRNPGRRHFVAVPWMKTRVVDPMTMEDVPEGGRGLLLHLDLANVYTAVAILTSDTATRVGDGFIDIERAPGAPARGCSLEAAKPA